MDADEEQEECGRADGEEGGRTWKYAMQADAASAA
jgi:hypothetical protein